MLSVGRWHATPLPLPPHCRVGRWRGSQPENDALTLVFSWHVVRSREAQGAAKIRKQSTTRRNARNWGGGGEAPGGGVNRARHGVHSAKCLGDETPVTLSPDSGQSVGHPESWQEADGGGGGGGGGREGEGQPSGKGTNWMKCIYKDHPYRVPPHERERGGIRKIPNFILQGELCDFSQPTQIKHFWAKNFRCSWRYKIC